jgi:hypothetical protein
MLDAYLNNAFFFEYESGLKLQLEPTINDKTRMFGFFKAKELTENDMKLRHEMIVALFQKAIPHESPQKIQKFIMANEDETLFLFYKHFDFIRVKDDETYSGWMGRLQEELKKKEQEQQQRTKDSVSDNDKNN